MGKPWPVAKRGKARMASRPVAMKRDFANATTKQVIDKLKKDKLLPEWRGATCPYCGVGTLAAVLFCAVAQCSQASARLLLKNNHKMAESIYSALYAARAKHVNCHEKNIVFGKDQDGNALEWADVEADEVDMAKGEGPNAGPRAQRPITWEQWGGIVQRGNPRSLVLFRLKPEKAKRRAPGPGPIRKRDWAPAASKWLKNRRVILHTDGARSHKMKVDDVLHDWVVHKKKRVQVGGKRVWLKPAFTKVRYHDVPDENKPSGTKRLWAKRGTQLIDRAWGDLRKAVGKGNAKTVGSVLLRNKAGNLNGACRVRSFQWAYWNRGSDLWLATGQMLRDAWAKDYGQ
ncbi:unnamed protein product [Prorocentrum cordatum]|uniref:Uncharacterized protein n=1 Tax=Prorocentrum cordatum TaxID=2364126 RepID=A0ABN9WBI6_9DINO|nr:unnamed protein product [Polarella glacialis]